MNQSILQAIANCRQECERVIRECSESVLRSDADLGALRREFGREFGREIADQLIQIATLQSKAVSKFGDGVWWVTQKSLQQATPWQVAALKASWLGTDTVIDLCCGVGGDAMQLVSRGPVLAIDSDPLMRAMAAANVQRAANHDPGSSHPIAAEVVCEDVRHTSLPGGCSLHIDPDRRPGQDRKTAPDFYQPAWHDVVRMIAVADSAVVKLAPAARIAGAVEESHRCWISLGGSVREQALLCGKAVFEAGLQPRCVSAVKVSHDGSHHRFAPLGDVPLDVPHALKPQAFLVDPDAAIRASGLTEAFACEHGLATLGGPAGFLTGDPVEIAAVCNLSQSQRVVWHGSVDDRKIRRELRQRDMYPLSIKVRGTDHDPARLTKRYRKCGTKPITLWFGRVGDRVYSAFTVPLE